MKLEAKNEQQVPYLVKLPYDLTRLLDGLTSVGFTVLIMGLGISIGLLLIKIFGAQESESLAGILLFLGVAIPWFWIIIDDIYFRSRRSVKKNSIYIKWCYVPPTKNKIETPKQAWVSGKKCRVVIKEPGFYFLKPGFHVMFVGTPEAWESFLDMAINGGL